jgi:hypothetical protein
MAGAKAATNGQRDRNNSRGKIEQKAKNSAGNMKNPSAGH